MKGQLTILRQEEFDAWLAQASAVSSLAYDADDAEAHWGWSWQEI
jgi:heme/copper-type cytochrome/quinol oxidase subunit 2